MPFFSVIVPVYNVERYLPECFASLEAQNFRGWECICVNDGSKDNSGVIVDEAARRDGRFRVVHQRNSGVSCARNRALERVVGQYFLFVDGDDGLLRGALQSCGRLLYDNTCDALYTVPEAACSIDDTETVPEVAKANPVHVSRVAESMRERLELLICGGNGVPWGKVFRSKVYGGRRFPDGIGMMEDLVFWERTLESPGRWGVLDAPFYTYRQRVGSATRSDSLLKCVSAVKAIAEVANRLETFWKPDVTQWRTFWGRMAGIYENYAGKTIFSWTKLSVQERAMMLSLMARTETTMKAACLRVPFSLRRWFLARGLYGCVRWATWVLWFWRGGISRFRRMLSVR